MSTFGIIALSLLPILGGLIAWAGDVIGYRLGKSRRTLFGLRPRATARLVGIVVGALLPLVGLGTALLGSEDARVAVFELDRLIRERDQLTQRNDQLRKQAAEAWQQADMAKDKVGGLLNEITIKSSNLSSTRKELGKTEAHLTSARSDVGRLRSAANRLQGRIGSLQSAQTELQAKNEHLKGRYDEAQANLQKTQEGIRKGKEELEALKAEHEGYKAQRDRIEAGPVALEAGHELVRAIVDASRSEYRLEEDLFDLLVLASAAARARGAEVGPNGRAVKVVSPLPMGAKPEDDVSESEIVTDFVRQLRASQNRSFVVSVRVFRRLFLAESKQAYVELRQYPNLKVFSKGEVIATRTVEGGGSRAGIYATLLDLLRGAVRREARKRDLLPHPETGQYGEVTAEALFAAIEALAAAKGTVTVRILAAEDTYTAGPLNVQIEVLPGEQT